MGHSQGSIEVICGSMFSGKTEELIRRLVRAKIARQQVQVFKPAIDIRFAAEKVKSHTGADFDAVPVERADEILQKFARDTTVVGIDEVILDPGIIEVGAATRRDGRASAGGWPGHGFFAASRLVPCQLLLSMAERVDKLHAICMVCGDEASRTQRLVNGQPARIDEPIVIVGAAEMYEAAPPRTSRSARSEGRSDVMTCKTTGMYWPKF